jgi:hypothetical protein
MMYENMNKKARTYLGWNLFKSLASKFSIDIYKFDLVYDLAESKFSYFELPIIDKRNVLRPMNLFYGSNSKIIKDMR